MLNAKKTLTKVLKVFDDMVLYDDQTSESKSVSANSTQVYSIDFSKQGYKVLGVKRINFNNTSCVNAGFSFDTTDTLTVVLRNTTNAAANAYIRVEVAYIKSELIGGGTP